jgi:hypothetical protein
VLALPLRREAGYCGRRTKKKGIPGRNIAHEGEDMTDSATRVLTKREVWDSLVKQRGYVWARKQFKDIYGVYPHEFDVGLKADLWRAVSKPTPKPACAAMIPSRPDLAKPVKHETKLFPFRTTLADKKQQADALAELVQIAAGKPAGRPKTYHREPMPGR